MKIQLKPIFPFLFIAIGCTACKQNVNLKTVSSVDLKRYVGTWYELASYPQFFERGCSNVRATYSATDDFIKVFNQSTKNGKPNEITGKAFVVPNSGNAKLKVQFFWPFKGDYWIIDLDKDYKWAIVSDPKQKTLWILSRTKTMDETLYNSLIDSLVTKGFDKQKIVKMVQE
ncbi:MAG: lipocalin family protein [Paludibacter sp.]